MRSLDSFKCSVGNLTVFWIPALRQTFLFKLIYFTGCFLSVSYVPHNLFWILQMRRQEAFSLKTNLSILIMGIIRIFFWWCLAELMIHLMYIHALYSSAPPLEAASFWALGEYRNSSRNLPSPRTPRTTVYYFYVHL